MKYKKSIALIEKGNDGTYGIFTIDLKSTIHGSGSTVAEAKAVFEDTIQEMREFMDKQDGIPNELTGIKFEYKYDMMSIFSCFTWLNVSKEHKLKRLLHLRPLRPFLFKTQIDI